jgi:hypothetical protein
MPIAITVKHRDGGSNTYKVFPAAEVKFEAEFKMPYVKAFAMGSDSFNTYIYKLAYFASRDTRPFDEWIDTVEELELAGNSTENPT